MARSTRCARCHPWSPGRSLSNLRRSSRIRSATAKSKCPTDSYAAFSMPATDGPVLRLDVGGQLTKSDEEADFIDVESSTAAYEHAGPIGKFSLSDYLILINYLRSNYDPSKSIHAQENRPSTELNCFFCCLKEKCMKCRNYAEFLVHVRSLY